MAGEVRSSCPSARRLLAQAAWCALMVTLASCGGSTPGRQPQRTSAESSARPVASSTPGAAGAVKTEVVGAYTGMWRVYAAAARTADYTSPALARYAAGDALMVLVRSLYNDHQRGVVIRGRPVLHPRVVNLTPATSPNQARVVDCLNDRHWLTYSRSGVPSGGAAAGRHRVAARLQLFGTVWKVTFFVAEKAGTC